MAKSKKPEVVKLDDSVVEELKQLRTEQSNTQLDIGSLATQQHILQNKMVELGQQLQGKLNELEKEHGQGSIDLEAGELLLGAPDNGNS